MKTKNQMLPSSAPACFNCYCSVSSPKLTCFIWTFCDSFLSTRTISCLFGNFCQSFKSLKSLSAACLLSSRLVIDWFSPDSSERICLCYNSMFIGHFVFCAIVAWEWHMLGSCHHLLPILEFLPRPVGKVGGWRAKQHLLFMFNLPPEASDTWSRNAHNFRTVAFIQYFASYFHQHTGLH